MCNEDISSLRRDAEEQQKTLVSKDERQCHDTSVEWWILCLAYLWFDTALEGDGRYLLALLADDDSDFNLLTSPLISSHDVPPPREKQMHIELGHLTALIWLDFFREPTHKYDPITTRPAHCLESVVVGWQPNSSEEFRSLFGETDQFEFRDFPQQPFDDPSSLWILFWTLFGLESSDQGMWNADCMSEVQCDYCLDERGNDFCWWQPESRFHDC